AVEVRPQLVEQRILARIEAGPQFVEERAVGLPEILVGDPVRDDRVGRVARELALVETLQRELARPPSRRCVLHRASSAVSRLASSSAASVASYPFASIRARACSSVSQVRMP